MGVFLLRLHRRRRNREAAILSYTTASHIIFHHHRHHRLLSMTFQLLIDPRHRTGSVQVPHSAVTNSRNPATTSFRSKEHKPLTVVHFYTSSISRLVCNHWIGHPAPRVRCRSAMIRNCLPSRIFYAQISTIRLLKYLSKVGALF